MGRFRDFAGEAAGHEGPDRVRSETHDEGDNGGASE